jgi:hypothetical protein
MIFSLDPQDEQVNWHIARLEMTRMEVQCDVIVYRRLSYSPFHFFHIVVNIW